MRKQLQPKPPASARERAFWYSLLCVIGLTSIVTPLYNRISPELWGIPFFLWAQVIWIAVGGITTFVAYKRGA